jgi:hypothetical protein
MSSVWKIRVYRVFIIVLRWQVACKAQIYSSVLSYEHGNIPVLDYHSTARRCYCGHGSETAQLPA